MKIGSIASIQYFQSKCQGSEKNNSSRLSNSKQSNISPSFKGFFGKGYTILAKDGINPFFVEKASNSQTFEVAKRIFKYPTKIIQKACLETDSEKFSGYFLGKLSLLNSANAERFAKRFGKLAAAIEKVKKYKSELENKIADLKKSPNQNKEDVAKIEKELNDLNKNGRSGIQAEKNWLLEENEGGGGGYYGPIV